MKNLVSGKSGKATVAPMHRLVFLGAGASVPYGYPVTSGILPAIWRGLEDGSWRRWAGLRPPKSGNGRVPAAVARDVGVFREVLGAMLPGLDGREPSKETSILDVMSLLDQLLIERSGLSPKIGPTEILTARNMLQLAMNGVLQGQKKKAVRSRMADWLLSDAVRDVESKVTIVTTNYDCFLEHELYSRIRAVGCDLHKAIDFGIPWRDAFDDQLYQRPHRPRLSVLKLHGSLDWLRCEVCGHVTINPEDRLTNLEFQRKKTEYNSCWCEGRLRSVLVTPSVVRDIRDPNLLAVWKAAVEELRNADEWVFLGYGLPSEDVAIRSVLLRALHSRSGGRSLRIRVVQKEGEDADRARNRYCDFFPAVCLEDSGWEVYPEGAETFATNLPPVASRGLVRSLQKMLPR